MTLVPPRSLTFACRILTAIATSMPLAAVAAGTDTTVYKCPQAGGAVLYADDPCKGGAIVEIRPGAADPAAIERLERAQADFDRAARQRSAGDELAALQRRELDQRLRELEAAQRVGELPPATYEGAYGPGYSVYAPQTSVRPSRHRHVQRERLHPQRRIPAVIRRPQAR